MAFDDLNQMASEIIALMAPPPPVPRPSAPRNFPEQSFVQFRNTTQRFINLYWIDNEGRRVLYAILKPNEALKANTFLSHPWLFRDTLSGEFMQVERQEMFWPEIYRVPHPHCEGQWIVLRKKVDIHVPVGRLSNRCLWQVAQNIMHEREPEKYLTELEIPETLKDQLKDVVTLIQNFEGCSGIWIEEHNGIKFAIGRCRENLM